MSNPATKLHRRAGRAVRRLDRRAGAAAAASWWRQITHETEAHMDAVLRFDALLKKARTSWLTPFMGGAFAGVFLFWVW